MDISGESLFSLPLGQITFQRIGEKAAFNHLYHLGKGGKMLLGEQIFSEA